MTESQQAEYKKTFGKEVIISLVAFANTEGGAVVVGVNDDGVPCGLEVGPETVQRYLNEIKVATYPQIAPKARVEKKDGKQVVIFEIPEFPVKPVAYKGRYYKRIHNSNHLLSLNEIVDLQQQALSMSFDAYPSRVSLADLDTERIEWFFSRVNSRGRVTLADNPRTNLVKLKFIRDGKITLAAELFNLSYHFDGGIERRERWQYPMEALRELLLNAVVHRDYKNPSDIVVKIFDDRIVFTNPGKLYGKCGSRICNAMTMCPR